MKTSRALQAAQDEQDNDTATEQRLVGALDGFERLVWSRASDGQVDADELRQITAGIRLLRALARRSLERNRLVASLLCAVAGGMDPYSDRARERLPALRLLPAREPEEDVVA